MKSQFYLSAFLVFVIRAICEKTRGLTPPARQHQSLVMQITFTHIPAIRFKYAINVSAAS
jgi:hypothetical protein